MRDTIRGMRGKSEAAYIAIFSVAAAAIFVTFWAINLSRADTVFFYPDSCLGSWRNPQKAAGAPENIGTANLDAENFTDANSSVFDGGISSIYCGNFSGEIPDEAEIQSVTLSLVIAAKETPAGPLLLDSTGSPQTEPTLEPSPGSSPSPSPESSPEPLPEPSPPITFWQKIFRAVFAQEITPEPSIEPSPTPVPAFTPSPAQTPTPSPSPTSAPTPTPTPEPTTSPSPTPESSPELSPSPEPTAEPIAEEFVPQNEPLFYVRYSLDSQNWQHLGEIFAEDLDEPQILTFQVPVSQWVDLQKIQISVISLPRTQDAPYVYLDGMRLEARYEAIPADEAELAELPAEEELLPQEAIPEPSPEPQTERQLRESSRPIKIDPEATHSCSVEPFSTEIRQDETKSISIIFNAPDGETAAFAELGDMPYGIKAHFARSGAATLTGIAGERKEELVLSTGRELQQGSLGVAVIFSRDLGSRVSDTICQFNLRNI